MKYGYYPGCSLEKNAASYNISALAVAKPLGMESQELDDWNCCGATEYMTINRTAAYSLIPATWHWQKNSSPIMSRSWLRAACASLTWEKPTIT